MYCLVRCHQKYDSASGLHNILPDVQDIGENNFFKLKTVIGLVHLIYFFRLFAKKKQEAFLY